MSTCKTNDDHRIKFINSSALGKQRLDRIRPDDVSRFLNEIELTVVRKVDVVVTRPSAAYVRRIHATVSKILSLAVRDGYIATNPARDVDLPRQKERSNRLIEPDEVPELDLDRRIDAIIQLVLHTGLRRGEVVDLEWRHLSDGLLEVPGTKTKSSQRTVPLSADALAAIEAQPRRSKFIFSTSSGKRLSADNLSREFRLRKAQLGIHENTRLHDLRGSFITIALRSGVDLRTIMELVGHSSPGVTLKAYARSNTAVKAKAIESIASALRPGRD